MSVETQIQAAIVYADFALVAARPYLYAALLMLAFMVIAYLRMRYLRRRR